MSNRRRAQFLLVLLPLLVLAGCVARPQKVFVRASGELVPPAQLQLVTAQCRAEAVQAGAYAPPPSARTSVVVNQAPSTGGGFAGGFARGLASVPDYGGETNAMAPEVIEATMEGCMARQGYVAVMVKPTR